MDYHVNFNLTSRFYVGFLLLSILASYWCQNSVVESCIQEERIALLSFNHDLISKDADGRLSSWVGVQCCQWRGISCNNLTGHVVKIDLRNPTSWMDDTHEQSNIRGQINSALLALKHLSYLDLSSNDFGQDSYTIPDMIGQLTSLRYLNLSDTKFSGEIPHSLSNLSNLNYLDLSSTYSGSLYSKDINWLSRLSSLKYLNLGRVDLSNTGASLLHQVNMLPSLLELHLSHCPIDDSFLSLSPHTSINLTSLLVLDFSQNTPQSSFPKWILNLTSLKELDLHSTRFSSLPLDEFVKLKSLEHLDLRLTGEVPKSVGNLCKLKSLNLGDNKFDGGFQDFIRGFSNCSYARIESLDLSSCGLESKLPTSLGMLKNLQHLDLSSNSFWGSIPEFVIGNLSSLKTLNFSGNHFNGFIPLNLGQLSQLVCLDLSENLWQGTLVEAHFTNLTSLEVIYLSTNQLEPIIFSFTNYEWIPPFKLQIIYIKNFRVGPGFPMWLQSQTELLDVMLTNTGISGPIPKEWLFKISSKIKYLILANNQISGKLPFQFIFPKLTKVDLSNNQFEGTIPPSICNMKSMMSESTSTFTLKGQEMEFTQQTTSLKTTIDLSSNNLEGEIPEEISCLTALVNLNLSMNQLGGNIPSEIGKMQLLESLDLSQNKLSRKIPTDIGNMLLLESLDLSHNKLSGDILKSLSNLTLLSHLNLSMNRLSGSIPSEIGKMQLLESLDLSQNKLSGDIPESLSNLTLLSHLNLSHNKLIGRIPTGKQLQKFDDPSIYVHNNPSLCGFPLPTKCFDDTLPAPAHEDVIEKFGLYVSVVLGFIIGFWGVCGSLILKKPWRYAYFKFFDNIKEKVALRIELTVARLHRRY